MERKKKKRTTKTKTKNNKIVPKIIKTDPLNRFRNKINRKYSSKIFIKNKIMTHMYIGNTCTYIHIAATLMLKKINRITHAQIKKKMKNYDH